jgi:hypothetical protein
MNLFSYYEGVYNQILFIAIYKSIFSRPRAEELLPNSCAFAVANFEDILPSSYQRGELNVMVDG